MSKVYGYVRVSSEDQNEEHQLIEMQRNTEQPQQRFQKALW